MVVVCILSLCCGTRPWSPIPVLALSPKDVLLTSTLTLPFLGAPLFSLGKEKTGREDVVGIQGFYFKSYFF